MREWPCLRSDSTARAAFIAVRAGLGRFSCRLIRDLCPPEFKTQTSARVTLATSMLGTIALDGRPGDAERNVGRAPEQGAREDRMVSGVSRRKGFRRRGLTGAHARGGGDAAPARIGGDGSSELTSRRLAATEGAANGRKRSPIPDAIVLIWRGNACCGVTTGETETTAGADNMAEG